jgi:hypothetical protein
MLLAKALALKLFTVNHKFNLELEQVLMELMIISSCRACKK